MTGFGSAELNDAGLGVRLDVRSVNSRHLKLATRLPALVEGLGAELEGTVRQRVTRGSVTVNLLLHREREAAPSRIVEAVLTDYLDQIRQVAAATGTQPPATLEAILRLPGVIEDSPARPLDDAEADVVRAALGAALDQMLAMREREGAALAAELESLLVELETWADRIEAQVPQIVAAYLTRLRQRVTVLLERTEPVAEEQLAREMALLADKTDVAEELARLRTHVAAWRAALAGGGPIGRRLDFVAQEMGRETNTIGSKVADAQVAQAVVELKLIVERLKEQAANVE